MGNLAPSYPITVGSRMGWKGRLIVESITIDPDGTKHIHLVEKN